MPPGFMNATSAGPVSPGATAPSNSRWLSAIRLPSAESPEPSGSAGVAAIVPSV